MTRRGLAWIVLPTVLACATVPKSERAGASYRFPNVFRANQTVRVTITKGATLELLASVRRVGGDYDVTLFDPLFATPLLSASSRDGLVTEDLLAPSAKTGWGVQLLGLLREVYEETYTGRADDTLGASGRTGSFKVSEINAIEGPCAFPRQIVASMRAATVQYVEVETLEVDCTLQSGE